MKIGMDINAKAIREYTKPMMDNISSSRTEKNSAARLDLSGLYPQMDAYSEHGKSSDEIMLEAGMVDVELQRNYMTVMSNTMSGEDYKKAMENGFDPSEMSGAESVTILDHIKAVMAQSGQVVAGYNDNLDSEIMKEVTGKAVDAASIKKVLESVDLPSTTDNTKKILEAIGMMDSIDDIPEGSIKYMVDNNLEPTIGNIYTARFSAVDDGSRQARGYYAQDMGGYLAKKADDIDWETMKPQVEKSLEQMNFDDMSKEEQLENAKWLLEKGLPVTEEKITELSTINQISFPVPVERIINVSIQAIAAGLEPKDGNLAKAEGGIYSKAYEQQEAVIKESLNREEARLKLSLDANIRLLKQGKSIDTSSIEDVIKLLKNEENQLRKEFFGEGTVEELESKTDMFVQTTDLMKEMPYLPAATIGRLSLDKSEFTVRNIHSQGTLLSTRYNQANESYEALGTEVRKDLGDSITKAFRNVDDILKDLNLDTSEVNRRAVRILGYNSMVINEAEIKKIVQADNKIQNVINGLTPGKTLQLIREGINPLDMNIDELVRHINELDHDPKRDCEKYSKFLYKLEKSGGITKEEKSSYLGIYRMINRLERTDHASIGRLMESGADITFGNLLTAMRSSKKSFNISIDDDFGMLSEVIEKGTSISNQIEAAFTERISEENNNKLEEMYAEEKATALRNASDTTSEVVEELMENNASVSANNIEAVQQFNNEPNGFFRYMRAYSRRIDNRTGVNMTMAAKLEKAVIGLTDRFESKEAAQEGYEDLKETMADILENMTDIGADTAIDFRTISLMYKQLSLITDYAKEENYHVPVMFENGITDINVKLVHGEDQGLVTTVMETERFGNVKTEIRLNGNNVEAIFIAENRNSTEELKAVGDLFITELQNDGYSVEETKYIIGNPKSTGKYLEKKADNNNKTVDTSKLYDVAKKFIESVQKVG